MYKSVLAAPVKRALLFSAVYAVVLLVSAAQTSTAQTQGGEAAAVARGLEALEQLTKEQLHRPPSHLPSRELPQVKDAVEPNSREQDYERERAAVNRELAAARQEVEHLRAQLSSLTRREKRAARVERELGASRQEVKKLRAQLVAGTQAKAAAKIRTERAPLLDDRERKRAAAASHKLAASRQLKLNRAAR